MKKHLLSLTTFLLCIQAYAQPSINASLGTDEYGTSNAYSISSSGATWYMTWDATYVYVLLNTANETEGAVLYFDFDVNDNPISGNGSSIGITHSTMTPDLPFNADAQFFCHNTYRRLTRYASGSWTDIYTPGARGMSSSGTDDYANGDYSSTNSGTHAREFRLRWSDLTGGGSKPDSFLVVGYVNYSTGIYGEMPLYNPTGNQASPSTPDFDRYFLVRSNTAAPASNPLTLHCFTQSDNNVSSFGSITIHHFTMARSGKTITKANTNSTWTISGNLTIANGTIDAGASANSHINVGGNVNIASGATFKLSTSTSDLFVGGDFTNDGTFETQGSNVEFNGAGDQLIAGTSLNTSTGTVNHFNKLTVNKSLGNLDLAANVAVVYQTTGSSGDVKFSNGKLRLNNFDLTINDDVTLTDYTDSKYFVTNGTGNLKITNIGASGNRTSTVVFPVGNAFYNPVSVLNVGTAQDYTINMGDYVTTDGTSAGTAVSSSVVVATWNVEASGSGSNVTLTCHWLTAQEQASFTANNCYLSHFTSGNWQMNTAAGSVTSGSHKTIARAGITSFSPFSVGSGGVLPVDMIDFSAQKLEHQVKLLWATASELNASHFSVYRSIDGDVKREIGHVGAQGNSATISKYSFFDDLPLAKSVYYYLKQIDYDGKHKWFGPVSLTTSEQNEVSLRLNKAASVLVVDFGTKRIEETARVLITNALGQTVVNNFVEFDHNKKSGVVLLPLMPAGVYGIQVQAGATVFAKKIYY